MEGGMGGGTGAGEVEVIGGREGMGNGFDM